MCQISAPVSCSPAYQRSLYLFGCLQPPCWNRQDSWACLRSQTPHQAQPQSDQGINTDHAQDNKVTDWLGEADDWGDGALEEEEDSNGNEVKADSQFQSDNNIVVPLQ